MNIMFDPVIQFCDLGSIPPLSRAGQISCNPADPFELDAFTDFSISYNYFCIVHNASYTPDRVQSALFCSNCTLSGLILSGYHRQDLTRKCDNDAACNSQEPICALARDRGT